MNRRQGLSSRPASSEELDTWSQAADSLATLATKYCNPNTLQTIERVNRLILNWPTDDTLPAEGLDGVKSTYKKLEPAIRDIQAAAEEEARAIEGVIERLEILIALRTASSEEKRLKRARGASPGGTPGPPANSQPSSRGVSITLPARSSVGPTPPIPFSRDPKARREALAKQLPLQEGRKVAFHVSPNKSTNNGTTPGDEDTWILAIITKCINADKNRYEVQDADPDANGDLPTYNTTLRSIIPLPDPNAAPGSASHVGNYQEFVKGSSVMALYPDTSCFYRAEVLAGPRDLQPTGRSVPSSKHIPTYKLKFDDDDNQEHTVPALWVVEWPNV